MKRKNIAFAILTTSALLNVSACSFDYERTSVSDGGVNFSFGYSKKVTKHLYPKYR